MRALYPKPISLPSLLLLAMLGACEQAAEKKGAEPYRDPWPNEHEVIFQEAEALKYSLEQHRLEEQRLRETGLPAAAPAPR